jgi:hypothetical protein
VTLASHAGNTWTLRQRRLASAVNEAIKAGGPKAYFIAVNKNAMIALELRRKAYDRLDTPYGASIEPLAQLALKRHAEMHVPIVIVADRFTEGGMPFDLNHAADALSSFDGVASTPIVRVLQWEGRNFAAGSASKRAAS